MLEKQCVQYLMLKICCKGWRLLQLFIMAIQFYLRFLFSGIREVVGWETVLSWLHQLF
jgi:hypothetical protein